MKKKCTGNEEQNVFIKFFFFFKVHSRFGGFKSCSKRVQETVEKLSLFKMDLKKNFKSLAEATEVIINTSQMKP